MKRNAKPRKWVRIQSLFMKPAWLQSTLCEIGSVRTYTREKPPEIKTTKEQRRERLYSLQGARRVWKLAEVSCVTGPQIGQRKRWNKEIRLWFTEEGEGVIMGSYTWGPKEKRVQKVHSIDLNFTRERKV